jgi:murein DD-endopeptidase MepM/ murein hydrolase activator NlpD
MTQMNLRAKLLLAAVVVLIVTSMPQPSWAAGSAGQVHEAHAQWEASVSAVRGAARAVEAAQGALASVQQSAAAAAAGRDEVQAKVGAHEETHAAAEAALADLHAEVRAMEAHLRMSAHRVTVAEAGARSRSGEFRAAAGTVAPDLREESRIRYELGRARLEKTTAEHRALGAARAERLAEVDAAIEHRDGLEAQRAELREALDGAVRAAEAAQAEVAPAAAVVEESRAALAARQADHDAALAAMRALGWRGGVLGRGGLIWPTDGPPGSRFGPRRHPISHRVRLHAGVDVPAPTGQPVVATTDGTVTRAGANGGYGFMVEIVHTHGRVTRYAHLSYISVRAGEQVAQGRRIGKVGSTGASTGPHLHFELWVHGKPRDPLAWFAGAIR